MAGTLQSPDPRTVQPDPVLTNLVQDNSANGGWFAPVGCSVKQVAKDYVRWAKQDSQSLLGNLFETVRTPGSRFNMIPQPVMTWVTSQVQEDALRAEYTEEDVNNSISPLVPAMNCAMRILNALQYAIESRVQVLFHAAGATAAASAAWSGAAGSIQSDIGAAKTAVLKNSGMPANFILIPPGSIETVLATTEVKNLQIFTQPGMLQAGGYPARIFGLRLFVPGARYDTVPTGTFTPGFVWDTNVEAYIGYSPTLDGGYWSGDGQAYATQFENQLNGSAFEMRTRRDPNFEENLTSIVYGNVRRSLPEAMNASVIYRLTGI